MCEFASCSSTAPSCAALTLPHLHCSFCLPFILFLIRFFRSLLPVTFIFPFPYWSCGILLPQNLLASAAAVSEIPARGFAHSDCPGRRACQQIPTGNQKVAPAQQWATSRMCSSVFLKYYVGRFPQDLWNERILKEIFGWTLYDAEQWNHLGLFKLCSYWVWATLKLWFIGTVKAPDSLHCTCDFPVLVLRTIKVLLENVHVLSILCIC